MIKKYEIFLETYSKAKELSNFKLIKKELPGLLSYANKLVKTINEQKDRQDSILFFDKSSRKLAEDIQNVIDFFNVNKVRYLIEEWQGTTVADYENLDYIHGQYFNMIGSSFNDLKKIGKIKLHKDPEKVEYVLRYDFAEDAEFMIELKILSMTFVDPDDIMGNNKIGISDRTSSKFDEKPAYFAVFNVQNNIDDDEIKEYLNSFKMFESFDLSVKDVSVYSLQGKKTKYLSFALIEDMNLNESRSLRIYSPFDDRHNDTLLTTEDIKWNFEKYQPPLANKEDLIELLNNIEVAFRKCFRYFCEVSVENYNKTWSPIWSLQSDMGFFSYAIEKVNVEKLIEYSKTDKGIAYVFSVFIDGFVRNWNSDNWFKPHIIVDRLYQLLYSFEVDLHEKYDMLLDVVEGDIIEESDIYMKLLGVDRGYINTKKVFHPPTTPKYTFNVLFDITKKDELSGYVMTYNERIKDMGCKIYDVDIEGKWNEAHNQKEGVLRLEILDIEE